MPLFLVFIAFFGFVGFVRFVGFLFLWRLPDKLREELQRGGYFVLVWMGFVLAAEQLKAARALRSKTAVFPRDLAVLKMSRALQLDRKSVV